MCFSPSQASSHCNSLTYRAYFSSVQSKMASMRSKTHMRSTPSLRRLPNVAFKTVPMFVLLTMVLSRPFKEDRRALPLSVPLLQAVDGVMSLALCLQAVSQAPQHFISSNTQCICEGCSANQSICSVSFFHCNTSKAVHRQEFSKMDVDHWHMPV